MGMLVNVWTDQRVERLTELWAAGWSCAQIATDLGGGITRNSVIGKTHRLKLPDPVGKRIQVRGPNRRSKQNPLVDDRPFLSPPPAQRLRNGYDPSHRRNPSQNILAKLAIDAAEPGIPAKFDEPAVGEGLKLIDLTDTTCRWPFGMPGKEDFYFCGDPSADLNNGRPYCPFHTRKGTNPAAIRNPRAFVEFRADRG